MSFVPTSFTPFSEGEALPAGNQTLIRSWPAPRFFSAGEMWPLRPVSIRTLFVIAILLAVALTVHVRSLPAPKASPMLPLQMVIQPRSAVIEKATPETLTPQALIPELNLDQARANNAAVPFTKAHFEPAPPYRFSGSDVNRAGAVTCLAAALLYEAGDDKPGQQAVAQVILNRLRHPAFPKTICGVVFQGAERSTGCQFTFACDGSLVRVPDPAAWKRANAVAQAALAGSVYGSVGSATHYHTDWVVPYWRDSLEKLAQVHTQIFYRWQGWQVKTAAKRDFAGLAELVDPRIAALALPGATIASQEATTLPDAPLERVAEVAAKRLPLEIPGILTSSLKGSDILFADPGAGIYFLRLDADAFPGTWAVVSYSICNGKPNCTVYGWTSAEQVPAQFPMTSNAIKLAAFSYQKAGDLVAPRWDCQRYPRREMSQCILGTRAQTNLPTSPMLPPLGQARADPKLAPEGETQS